MKLVWQAYQGSLQWRHNGTIASQITSLTIVYSTVYSDADQRKHQSSASRAFVWEIHRWPVNSPHKWPVTRKMFPFDDVIVYFQYWFTVGDLPHHILWLYMNVNQIQIQIQYRFIVRCTKYTIQKNINIQGKTFWNNILRMWYTDMTYGRHWMWRTLFWFRKRNMRFNELRGDLHTRNQPLQWRHNDHDSVSNHQPHDCLLNRLFWRRSKKTSKLRVTGLCAGNSPGTGECSAQMASNAENISIWWRHHDCHDSKCRPFNARRNKAY